MPSMNQIHFSDLLKNLGIGTFVDYGQACYIFSFALCDSLLLNTSCINGGLAKLKKRVLALKMLKAKV